MNRAITDDIDEGHSKNLDKHAQPQPLGQKAYNFSAAPRCGAKAKCTGLRCRQPAMRGKRVCQYHGGRGGAPVGNKNRQTHGRRSAEYIARERWFLSELRRIEREGQEIYDRAMERIEAEAAAKAG